VVIGYCPPSPNCLPDGSQAFAFGFGGLSAEALAKADEICLVLVPPPLTLWRDPAKVLTKAG